MPACLFCDIVNHRAPSTSVYEDDAVMAFNDISPKAPVHVLIVPKEHIESVSHLADQHVQVTGKLMIAARNIAKELGIADSGYKLVINTGRDGGQIISHLHIHLLGGKPINMIV